MWFGGYRFFVVYVLVPVLMLARLYYSTHALVDVLYFLVIPFYIWQFVIQFIEFNDESASIKRIMIFLSMVSFSLVIVLVFAILYKEVGILASYGETHDPNAALFYSIMIWTTIGFGPYLPTDGARVLTSLQAFLGYFFMAIIFAVFLDILKKNK